MNNQQRMDNFKSIALQNSWSFTATADASSIPALQEFEFQTGEKRDVSKIENLIEGQDFKVFDVYWKNEFKTSDALGPLAHKDNSAQNSHQQTMFLFESEDLHLKKFYVYPTDTNNWLNNWIDKTFLQSNFSDYPEFEKRWVVRGAIKEVFNKNVIEFYQKIDECWTFAEGHNLFIYKSNILIAPTEISDWIKKMEILSSLLST